MGPAIPFTYAVRGLTEANGLHTATPADPRLTAIRPQREARRRKRVRLALWHHGHRHAPVVGA